ncbi:MAG: sulfatase-like hydrolase/transferase [Planctomycetes bacterium]|nr:sulfatase-like hydrolase/transferase [Planctomycetota bacterium]
MKAEGTKKNRFYLFVLTALLVVMGGFGCYFLWGGPEIRNVVLISIDTCRADRLGCYGYDRAATGVLDALAGEGILYTKARTPVPMTLPSHCSMLTGTYPPYHRVHDNFDARLDTRHVTLSEILSGEGFVAGAIVSSMVLREGVGLDQGFDSYNDDFGVSSQLKPIDERTAEPTSRLAVEFIEGHQEEPFFLFLHYFDPHDKYEPPEPYASRFADDLYSGEIAYTDACIGMVIDCLKELDLYDSTLIVVVGDHGEGLGDHGESTHGFLIYQSTIQVPFIIRGPGVKSGQVNDQTVSLVDLAPTVLGYLDLEIPEHMQGVDLSDRTPQVSGREVFTESLLPTKFDGNPLLGVVSDKWSYIHSLRPELYDLAADRGELRNLLESENQQVRLMQSHLSEMVAEMVGAESADEPWVLDDETRSRLESLGYVGEVTISKSLEIDSSKKDPKDLIEYHEARDKLAVMIGDRDYETARLWVREIIRRWPEISSTYYMAMTIAQENSNLAGVLEYGQEYIARRSAETGPEFWKQKPGEAMTYLTACEMMSRAAFTQGEYNLVVDYCQKMRQIALDDPRVMNMEATAYFKLGEHQQAFDLWDQTAQLKPDFPELYNNWGQACFELGDYSQAMDVWATALQLRPQWAEVRRRSNIALQMKKLHQLIEQYWEQIQQQGDDPELRHKLALVFYQIGDFEMAIEQWQSALRLKPEWSDIYNNLGGAYYKLNQQAAALEHWRKSLELNPDETESLKNLALLLATARDESLQAPAEAVQLGRRAAELTDNKRADILDVLSIALAANGQYSEAMEAAEKALALAQSAGMEALAEKLRQNITIFRTKRDGNIRQRQH